MNKRTMLTYAFSILAGFILHNCSSSSMKEENDIRVTVDRAGDITSANLRDYIVQALGNHNLEYNSQAQICSKPNLPDSSSNLNFKESPLFGRFEKRSPYRLQAVDNLYWDMCSVGLLDHSSLPSACSRRVLGSEQLSIPVYGEDTALKYAKDTIDKINNDISSSSRRLPSVSELSGLLSSNCENPSINLSLFPNTIVGAYWAVSNDGKRLVAVDFKDGSILTETESAEYSIRLVRSAVNNEIRKNGQMLINRHIIPPRFRD